MPILSWDRAWATLEKQGQFRNRKKSDFRFVALAKKVSLSTGATTTTPIDFGALAVILAVRGSATDPAGTLSATVRNLLDAVRFGLEYPGGAGNVVPGGPVSFSSLIGPNGDLPFPSAPIIVPNGSSLIATLANLTTSTISVDIAVHAMQLNA